MAAQFSAIDVIDTLSSVLVERYGKDAIAIATRQAALARDLPRETWEAIIARLREIE